jgi:hypothetical protein
MSSADDELDLSMLFASREIVKRSFSECARQEKKRRKAKIQRISVDAPVPVSRYFGEYRPTASFAVFAPIREAFRKITVERLIMVVDTFSLL